jgi:glycosyltransferase involved in cell wall biosynthesis
VKLRLLQRADAVVAMSGESLRELRACGYPMSAVLRTPNGIRAGVAPARATVEGPCRVVFVGRLDPGKGLEDLLDVWPGVLAAAPAATLEIWGQGPLRAELEDRARRLGISGSLAFRGHVDSVPERLRGMDVFVLPSHAEGNSNAILEAMAAGLPVVSTAVGGTPMLVGPEAAYLVKPGDRAGLERHLVALARDPGARLAAGRAMRSRVERHFDMRRVAATYLEAYRRLAAGKRHTMEQVGDPLIKDD